MQVGCEIINKFIFSLFQYSSNLSILQKHFHKPSDIDTMWGNLVHEGWKPIIYIMLLSDLEKLLSVWENVLSIANVT